MAELLVLTVFLLILTTYRPQFPGLAIAGVVECLDFPPQEEDRQGKSTWLDFLYFKKGGDAPAPDPRVGQAALENAELGRNWLDFAREQFDEANERQGRIDKLTTRIGEQQIGAAERGMEWSEEDRARYKDKFIPLEDEFIERAKRWGSKEGQEEAAAEARADVMKSADMQRQITSRNLARMGIDPRSGRHAGVARTGAVNTALAAAGAENQARDIKRKEGMAMQSDAINLGRGLPSQAASGATLGLNAGQAALSGQLSAAGNQRANTGIMGQGFQGAMSGNSSMANILQKQHGQELSAWKTNREAAAAEQAAWAQAAGMAAGAFASSSKDAKTDKKPVKGALKAVKGMPVESWRYNDGETHPKTGQAMDTDTHVGPYAEDFKQQTGTGDGKTIDLISAIGITMKAVQELDDKVDMIKKAKRRATA
jgi:hypothetical protein